MADILRIAVVGHTNTGKTSLMRTLVHDSGFGEVSNRPATTRRVEGAVLMVDGEPLVELYDTPGLEDSIGLLEKLERMRGNLGLDWTDTLRRFVDSDEADGPFAQEAKTLSHLLQCDVGLYVIDVRDRVMGKHRDELEVLGRTAIPIVPVLNFVASEHARTEVWREQLARANMHAVAEFDTMILDFDSELRLFETLKVLATPFRPTIEKLVEHVKTQRTVRVQASANLLADLLIDTAAYTVVTGRGDSDQPPEVLEDLKARVRRREQETIAHLLALHEFDDNGFSHAALPLRDGAWGFDPFSPEALRQFGIRAGSAAAAGAMAGLAVDVLSAGVTLGVGTATGAMIGAAFGAAREKGREVLARLGGETQLQVDDATLHLLIIRNARLVEALFRRGHASQDPLRLNDRSADRQGAETWQSLRADIRRMRAHPEWSSLAGGSEGQPRAPGRSAARDAAAGKISELLFALLDHDVSSRDQRP